MRGLVQDPSSAVSAVYADFMWSLAMLALLECAVAKGSMPSYIPEGSLNAADLVGSASLSSSSRSLNPSMLWPSGQA